MIILNFKDFNHRLNSICAGCRQVYKMKGYFSLPAAIKNTAAVIFPTNKYPALFLSKRRVILTLSHKD
ncbi:hypothetical protein E4W53_11965 [Klebsiella pneumoniae]|nr:hypothetical protein [Klebsiella pneumoniae]NHX44324.1 hypothetical protein [Klebsiella pneumoniae]RJK82136.1 hypothetical protein CMV56_00200 [Klebsiella pneumoniae]HBW8606811.1 hypothetical protein [Klebsiella pneumoniae]HBW8698614.1 hypothetical protein [Klebsiella pneumoniae]